MRKKGTSKSPFLQNLINNWHITISFPVHLKTHPISQSDVSPIDWIKEEGNEKKNDTDGIDI